MIAPSHVTIAASTSLTEAGFRLEDAGVAILPKLTAASTIAQVNEELADAFADTPMCEGPFYGERTKRFGRLPARSRAVHDLIMHPTVLSLAERVLAPWCDVFQLNVAQAIEIHAGALAQFPHRDQDMWWGEKGRIEYLVNVIWPLDTFRAENGATRFWPDSHGTRALTDIVDGQPTAAECEPGDAIVFLGSTLHAAGANRTSRPRRAVVIGYSLGWLKPYENPWLAYPPELASGLPPDLAALVGYRQHRPNLGNFEGQCPSVLLSDRAERPRAATDALRPEQQAMLANFVSRQTDQDVVRRAAIP